LKPANSIGNSVPGRPITPEVRISIVTPAKPRSRITCVATVTSAFVTLANSSSMRV